MRNLHKDYTKTATQEKTARRQNEMSEIAKCPICQSTMTLYEEHMDGSDAIACNKCSFTCAEKDLPRVTAAMELAKAESKMIRALEDCAAFDCARIDLSAAKMRVLEVFK